MAEWTFDAPGGLKDFRDPKVWHEEMKNESFGIVLILVADALGKDPREVTAQEFIALAPSLSYFDPTNYILAEAGFDLSIPDHAQTIPIQAWGGFPRAVRRRAPWAEFPPDPIDADGSYRAVEAIGDEDHRAGVFEDNNGTVLDFPTRHRQDEYLEWAVRRDQNGKITKIIFVAEGYDYFVKLFEVDEQRVVDIYKEFTETNNIVADDLRARNGLYRRFQNGQRQLIAEPGAFNPRNTLNIDPGIVHLSHRANSLGAEVNLAGVSALARRKADGSTLDGSNEEELICCNQGGSPNRNSDPQISKQAYQQVLGSFIYTLANPVGLYIAGIDDQQLLLPDNRTPVPREWWKVERGFDLWERGPNNTSMSRALRVVLEVPAQENLTISDLRILGNHVTYPGQVAELLSVHLFVTRWQRDDNAIGPIVNCLGSCCRANNSDILFASGGLGQSVNFCPVESSLAFPGLVADQPVPFSGGVALLSEDVVDASTSLVPNKLVVRTR